MLKCLSAYSKYKKSIATLLAVSLSSVSLLACAPTKPPIKPLTTKQKRDLAIHLLALEHVPVINRGNQIDVLIQPSFLFNFNSTNLSPQAPYILSPLYHLIKLYNVQTVSVKGLVPTPAYKDARLLTRARAGIVGQHLWLDGLQKRISFIHGGLQQNNVPVSNLLAGYTTPVIWVHWRYFTTPRMYD